MNTLILVDLQNDFMPGGALAVPEGDQVVQVANRMIPFFDWVIATKDWHPSDHGSFASQYENQRIGEMIQLGGLDQVLWPDHCIQDSFGAQLHQRLNTDQLSHVVLKGIDREVDSYSGFFDNGRKNSTGLDQWLRERDVRLVAIMGLATDYCVKFTALDSVKVGFDTQLVIDGCRAVGLNEGDENRACQEMKEAGVQILTADQWIADHSESQD